MSNSVTVSRLSDEGCNQVLNNAVAEAEREGVTVSIAVVDESGIIKRFIRMDGASLASVDLSVAKARMAVSFGVPTDVFREMSRTDSVLAASVLAGLTNAVILGGGAPILLEGATIGAVGVSGPVEDQDMEIARRAASLD